MKRAARWLVGWRWSRRCWPGGGAAGESSCRRAACPMSTFRRCILPLPARSRSRHGLAAPRRIGDAGARRAATRHAARRQRSTRRCSRPRPRGTLPRSPPTAGPRSRTMPAPRAGCDRPCVAVVITGLGLADDADAARTGPARRGRAVLLALRRCRRLAGAGACRRARGAAGPAAAAGAIPRRTTAARSTVPPASLAGAAGRPCCALLAAGSGYVALDRRSRRVRRRCRTRSRRWRGCCTRAAWASSSSAAARWPDRARRSLPYVEAASGRSMPIRRPEAIDRALAAIEAAALQGGGRALAVAQPRRRP